MINILGEQWTIFGIIIIFISFFILAVIKITEQGRKIKEAEKDI